MIEVTESNSESFAGLAVIFVLSLVLVGALLFWHPWLSSTNAWTPVPQQMVPDDASPAPGGVLT